MREEFLNYTNNFLCYGEMIKLKVNHTLRVAQLCQDLGSKLGFSQNDLELVCLCGLLHDIGRFSQWQKYKTYVDSKSIDHGEEGYALLKNGLIDKFSYGEQDLILKVVRYHNKYTIPKDLDTRTKLFLKVIKDCDKIDTLYVYAAGLKILQIGDGIMSAKMYNELFKHTLLNLKEKETKADSLAIPLAFIYDFNFKRSLEIVYEQNYIDMFINRYLNYTKNEVLKEQLTNIRIDILKYLEEKIEC